MCQAATVVRNTGINIIPISQTRAAKLHRAEEMSQKVTVQWESKPEPKPVLI